MSDFKPFHWVCPHCKRDTTVVRENIEVGGQGFEGPSRAGQALLTWRRICCPNPDCAEYEFEATLHSAKYVGSVYANNAEWTNRSPFGRGRVRFYPKSSAIAFPEFVPLAIRNDYEEACDIGELSPKASATLARRALQGIVRDFWGATGRTLKDEIDSVQTKCDPLIWEAMEAVRKVGNICAHMERDVNTIVDVEPDEAQMLIDLIETLVRETYEARHGRTSRMLALKSLADSKVAAKKP